MLKKIKLSFISVSFFLIKYALAVFVVSIFSANCAGAQIISNHDRTKDESTSKSVDLSTDETIIAELQKIVDANNAKRANGDEKLIARQKAANRLKKEDVCIQRLNESAEIIVIGFFRYDYGCHFEGAFVGSRFFEADDNEIHNNALDTLGWKTAKQNERENLVKIWVEKGLLAFSEVLYARDKDLNDADFHQPKIVSNENGEISVSLWISFVRRKKEFEHLELKFTKDGSLAENQRSGNQEKKQ